MNEALRSTAELSRADKVAIREGIVALVESVAAERAIHEQAVANEAFYLLQRHRRWGRNATEAARKAAYDHARGICHRCARPVRYSDANFHHLKRGIPDQHRPGNLVPEHQECHDAEHEVTHGSLSKGAPKRHATGKLTHHLRRGD